MKVYASIVLQTLWFGREWARAMFVPAADWLTMTTDYYGKRTYLVRYTEYPTRHKLTPDQRKGKL